MDISIFKNELVKENALLNERIQELEGHLDRLTMVCAQERRRSKELESEVAHHKKKRLAANKKINALESAIREHRHIAAHCDADYLDHNNETLWSVLTEDKETK
jgi:chromosome segregation ATPase